MRKLLLLLGVSVGLFLPASAHAYCYGVTDPAAPGNVCGLVTWQSFNGAYYYQRKATTSWVKICAAGTSLCQTTRTGTFTDGANRQVEAYAFPRFSQGTTMYADYDVYAWSDSINEYWGSSTRPIRRVSIGPEGLDYLTINMPPRPLDPTPLYPSGSTVPSSYFVRWKSGRDIDRSPYPMTYEVWYKYWPFGGFEPATWTLARGNMPCHDDGTGPDANNDCSTYVAGPQAAGNWKWHVVANLNVGWVTYYPNTLFTTKSGSMPFIQPQ